MTAPLARRATALASALACVMACGAPALAGDLKALEARAAKGDVEAQFELALAYDACDGVALDDQKPLAWYTRAARQGHLAATFNRAWMYDEGEGTKEDNLAAIKWYRKAAEAGH